MKHLLIDFDSTIPNLALMKISAWAKQREHYKYILNLPDEEFLEVVRNFYKGEK